MGIYDKTVVGVSLYGEREWKQVAGVSGPTLDCISNQDTEFFSVDIVTDRCPARDFLTNEFLNRGIAQERLTYTDVAYGQYANGINNSTINHARLSKHMSGASGANVWIGVDLDDLYSGQHVSGMVDWIERTKAAIVFANHKSFRANQDYLTEGQDIHKTQYDVGDAFSFEDSLLMNAPGMGALAFNLASSHIWPTSADILRNNVLNEQVDRAVISPIMSRGGQCILTDIDVGYNQTASIVYGNGRASLEKEIGMQSRFLTAMMKQTDVPEMYKPQIQEKLNIVNDLICMKDDDPELYNVYVSAVESFKQNMEGQGKSLLWGQQVLMLSRADLVAMKPQPNAAPVVRSIQ